jgi:DNA-binding NarL/FixJ family response regulator
MMSAPTGPIRILAVDDHPVLRDGIGALMANQPDLQLVAEASTGREAVEQFRRYRPDITLMDLQMPDMSGIDSIHTICAEFPAARIVVLTTYAGDVLAQRALKAGARGYVLKSLVRKELLETIRAVHRGHKRVHADVAVNIASHAGEALLTPRETEVLQLAAAGLSNKRIAENLCINDETAKGHMKNILAKLDANDRTHAVTLGLKRGIIEL